MHYVLDENNNKVEAYDKEEVLAAIEKAIADGSLADLVADAAFVTKLKCCVGGVTHQVAFVTQAQYNELEAKGSIAENCVYFITDDTTAADINGVLTTLTNAVNNFMNGSQAVAKAKNAEAASNYTRVYSVALKYIETVDDYGNITGEYGDVSFNWYTNKDIEPTLAGVMDDILEKIGKDISTIEGLTETETYFPCSGYVVEGTHLTDGGESVLNLEPVIKVKLRTAYMPDFLGSPSTSRYVSFVYVNKASASDEIDLEKITATITKLN